MRKYFRSMLAVAVVSVLGLSSTVASGSTWTDKLKEKKLSVGLQQNFQSAGPSVKIPVSEKFSLQGVVGLLGSITSYQARGIYDFKASANWNAYGYGGATVWTAFGQSATLLQVGVGAEYQLRKLSPGLSNWRVSGEVGTFAGSSAIISGVGVGLGLHYKF